jgi:hypothetical protein
MKLKTLRSNRKKKEREGVAKEGKVKQQWW